MDIDEYLIKFNIQDKYWIDIDEYLINFNIQDEY
jgi:hypothetical protein